jgi:hypothetical protein
MLFVETACADARDDADTITLPVRDSTLVMTVLDA